MTQQYIKCKLCGEYIGRDNHKDDDNVKVWGDLFGQKLEEVFHEKCWESYST